MEAVAPTGCSAAVINRPYVCCLLQGNSAKKCNRKEIWKTLWTLKNDGDADVVCCRLFCHDKPFHWS